MLAQVVHRGDELEPRPRNRLVVGARMTRALRDAADAGDKPPPGLLPRVALRKHPGDANVPLVRKSAIVDVASLERGQKLRVGIHTD